MYQYTPRKDLLKDLLKARKKGYNRQFGSSYEYQFASQFCNTYSERVNFLMHWEHVNFFSEERRTHVPVNGVPFPVKFFDERKR
jgi:hypothetical protein